METPPVKTAFILGAGLGTRLKPLTDRRPKPLLPVGGRPLITHVMDHLLSAGIERFIVNTHHRAGAYDRAFPDGAWRGRPIVFRHEPVLLDTGGGLKNIADLLAGDARLLVYNGDILTDLPLAPLLDAHRRSDAEVTLALRSSGTPLNVTIDGAGNVRDMRDLLGDRGVTRCLFAGIYVMETRFLEHLPGGAIFSIVPALVDRIRRRPGAVGGQVIDAGRWHDIGSPAAYDALRDAWSPAP